MAKRRKTPTMAELRLHREKRQRSAERLLQQQQRDAEAGITPAMKVELQEAVQEAERMVEDWWRMAPSDITIDSPEAKAWLATPPSERRSLYPLETAKAAARATAREEVRARWAKEKAEREAEAKALPPHIARLTPQESNRLRELESGVDHVEAERAAYVAKVIRALPTQAQRDEEIEKLRAALAIKQASS
jgi:hypothetical protein